MKRLALCCVPLVLGLACWPVAVDAGKTAPFTIDPIRALFVTSEFATDYRITWRQPLSGTVKPEVEWSFHLQIVGGDAGKPYRGSPVPGAPSILAARMPAWGSRSRSTAARPTAPCTTW